MFVFDKIAVILILGQNGASTPTKRSNDNCTTICAPISELASDCGYRNSTDMMGAHGEAMMQCICKNTSFNVSLITPLCASCVQENGSGGMCMQGMSFHLFICILTVNRRTWYQRYDVRLPLCKLILHTSSNIPGRWR